MSTESKVTPPPVAASPRESSTTCIVGCKLPHGLKAELIASDGKIIAYELNGKNASRIVGGYGLTEGVPTDFMQEWLTRNADHPAVKNGSVFMHNTSKGAEARAREGRDIRTGVEPIDPVRDAKARGLELDREAVAAYEKQKAENPMRNRQVVVE